MTNNEQVKQAITNNMASIYSALEQVGATLPEKKNLNNISNSILGLRDSSLYYFCYLFDILTNGKQTLDIDAFFTEAKQLIKIHGGY